MSRTARPLLIMLALLACAGRAGAFTGGDGIEDGASLALTVAPAGGEVVGALQLKKASATGLGLNDAPGLETLLGHYGLSAVDVLKTLAPHLTACTVKLASTETSGDVVHEYYDLYFGAYQLAHAVLHLHHQANRLVMVRGAFPEYRLPAAELTSADFLPLATLGFTAPADGIRQSVKPVIAESSGFPAAAWQVTRFDERTGVSSEMLVDAQTGAVLERRETAFDVAEVYAKGPKDGALVTVALPDLPPTGYLDGKYFAVYAPTAADPRVQAPDGRFDFRPDDPADALSFDQVQTYYGATRALAWFQSRFGFDMGAALVTLRVNTLVGGKPDNALYLPPPVGPEIQIGKGNDVLTNLGRDSDVVSHEFSHHVIYQHLKSASGESGVLHEGTADYFAYALNGDPCLAESVVVGGGCLRTALLPEDQRYETIEDGRDSHYRGQYWSAVLWELRQKLGDSTDKLVYDALAYLGPQSGLRDAFLALLNADRDQNPLPPGVPEAGVFGQNKCLILATGVKRGFAAWLGDFDGGSCGLNLVELAEASRDLAGGKKSSGHGARTGFTLFGKRCAVVPAETGFGPGKALLLLILPALVGLTSSTRRKGKRHGT